MNFINKWKKRMKRLKKGHKVYKAVKKNTDKIVLVAETIHKAIIK